MLRSTLRPKAMPMETGPFLSDAPAAFTARLDALHPDQNAEDLSSALRAAFQRRDLFDSYVFSSVGGTERAKALLEVFDKVCSVKYPIP